MKLVIAGCSSRKQATSVPIPALDLYQGGCIPALRARVGADPELRQRVRILSARHGLVQADQLLAPYDQVLDLERALELRLAVTQTVLDGGRPDEVLAVLEPLYMVCLAGLLALPGRPAIRWVADPTGAWSEAAAVLDEWRW
jgi:hypothetical protein